MNYKILNFQQHGDERGMLVALEESKEIPFSVKRVCIICMVKPKMDGVDIMPIKS